MSSRSVLEEIKRELEPFIGTFVKLKANKGRKKIVERSGVLENIYPNIFVIKVTEKSVERRVSFSYTDILTETVILTVNKDGRDQFFQPSSANA